MNTIFNLPDGTQKNVNAKIIPRLGEFIRIGTNSECSSTPDLRVSKITHVYVYDCAITIDCIYIELELP